MKKIIDRKSYNTETAREIAYAYGNLSNFSEWHETLYQTKRGAYFLHGEGGPQSRWCRQVNQNEWTGGSGIEPVTPDQAEKWLEENEFTEELEKEFGPAEEADAAGERKKITLYGEGELIKKMKMEALEKDISAADLFNQMLKERYQ